MNGHLTIGELLKARNATGFLLDHAEILELDPVTVIKLKTIHEALAEQSEDRKVVTELPQRVAGLSGFTPAAR